MCIYMYKIYIKQKYVTLHSIEYLKVSPRPQATNAFIHGSIPPFSLHLGTLAVSVNGFSYRSICSLPRIEFRFSHLPPRHRCFQARFSTTLVQVIFRCCLQVLKKALPKSIMVISHIIIFIVSMIHTVPQRKRGILHLKHMSCTVYSA